MVGRDKGTRGSDELAAEIEGLRPYIDLAKEIRDSVERFASDDTADVDMLVEAIDAIPLRQRAEVAQTVFEQLPAERQWAILERVFGDDELRRALAAERAARLAELGRHEDRDAIIRLARAESRLDLGNLRDGQELVLGLFRSRDVRSALARGSESQVCAREIVLRATSAPGELRVIDDVFNPRRGYFVTVDYDENVWRTEHLISHTLVRLGSVAAVRAGEGTVFEAILYPAARVDFALDGEVREGHLHLGYAVLDESEVFASRD